MVCAARLVVHVSCCHGDLRLTLFVLLQNASRNNSQSPEKASVQKRRNYRTHEEDTGSSSGSEDDMPAKRSGSECTSLHSPFIFRLYGFGKDISEQTATDAYCG